MTNRIGYIDIAKGIGILLVYIGHCNMGNGDFTQLMPWIYAFHMPLFFFVSGLLFPDKPLAANKFYRNKFASLVVPYILFSILNYVLIKLTPHYGVSMTSVLLYGWGKNALWFIPILLLANMFHFHIIYGKWWEKIVVLVCLILLLIWKTDTNGWAPYCVSELPWFYFCFLSGFLMKDMIKKIEDGKAKWIYGIAGLGIMTLLLYLVIYPYNHDYLNQNNDYLCWFMKYGVGMIGTISILLISMSLQMTKIEMVLTWLGCNSLVILCTHQLYYNILQKINYQPFLNGGYNHVIIWILIVLSILLYNKYVSPLIKRIHS